MPRCLPRRLIRAASTFPSTPLPAASARPGHLRRLEPPSPAMSAAAHGLHAEPPPLSSLDPSHPRERVPLGSLILPSPLTAALTLRSAASAVNSRHRPPAPVEPPASDLLPANQGHPEVRLGLLYLFPTLTLAAGEPGRRKTKHHPSPVLFRPPGTFHEKKQTSRGLNARVRFLFLLFQKQQTCKFHIKS